MQRTCFSAARPQLETYHNTLSHGEGGTHARTRTNTHSGFLRETRPEIICSVTLTSQHLSPLYLSPVILSSSSSPLVFSPPLTDRISNLNIPLMSPLLLLKILSPNQIHQLALMLLLLLSFMSVKPRKLDLLSGTPTSSSSSFSLCPSTPLLFFHQERLLCALSSLCVLVSFIQLAPSPWSE